MPRLLAFLLVLAAFVARPAAAQVDGMWALVHINGDSLPATSPMEDNVTIERLKVTLGAGTRYTLQLRARAPGMEKAVDAEVGGTYAVTGDRIYLRADEKAGADAVEFRWALAEGVLRWWDEDDNVLAFARQP